VFANTDEELELGLGLFIMKDLDSVDVGNSPVNIKEEFA